MISPLFLLIIGLVLVIGGIVWLRMHAFLALALSAFVVGSLTPTAYLERHFTEEKGESQQSESLGGGKHRQKAGRWFWKDLRKGWNSYRNGRDHRHLRGKRR